MIRKTITAALAVAVISTSAMMVTATNSQAGGYYNGGGYGHVYYPHHCYWKKIKVWGYYGYFWKKIKVCH